MIKTIVKDVFFLGQKSTEATKEDLYLAKDLRDTLEFHKDACVGMAANMIGVKKRVIIVNIGFVNLVMFNPVLVSKSSPFQTEESCLSLEGSRPTRRYESTFGGYYYLDSLAQALLGFRVQSLNNHSYGSESGKQYSFSLFFSSHRNLFS